MSGNLSGPDRAAIFMMAIGESAAAEVMRHLGPREVQTIGTAMARLSNVSTALVKTTVHDFVERMNQQTAIGIGSEDYIRTVLTEALGADKAGGMIDRILLGGNTKGLESLKWLDARSVVDLIRSEHPQIIAIVLSYLDNDQAAEVLEQLPEPMHADLLLRIASLESVQPLAIKELNAMLEAQMKGGSGGTAATMGGVKCAAGIMNFLDRGLEATISEKLAEQAPEVAEQIQDLMFTFENIGDIDDRGIQTLLREVSTDNLVLALKGTDDGIRDKVFANMSSRAAEMLKDDLDAKGPVKLSEVEAAQKEILAIARRLAEEGQIALGGAGGEEMV